MKSRPSDLRRLYADLGLKPLNRTWAKMEIVLGLGAAGVGLLLGDWAVGQQGRDMPWGLLAAALALFVLGGYLAMAGHRSHLYQSNNYLTGCLLDEMRRPGARGTHGFPNESAE